MTSLPMTSIKDSAATVLSLHNISFRRHGETILDNVSLSLCKGEILTLIGPNGSGKSTLVKTALGLIQADSGSINIAPNTRIGYVPQRMDIDPTLPMTVNRFLALNQSCEADVIEAALKRTGAVALVKSSLHTLSGGEMRRVLLARALIYEPDILILDEPTAGVDISGQAALYTLIQDLRDELGCGVLLVSHDLHIVMAATDKVVCLNHHLCCSGTPQSVSQAPEFVSLFGEKLASELAVYHHHHDHEHGLHGEVCEPGTETSTPHG